ncbi:hypothetical protein Tco_0696893 [Tanacetum coccineum]
MLAPSGGGLTLYQAYGRKSYLLEDKQILSVRVFDEVLEKQPFIAAKQAGFNLEDIILNTNDEVALLYPEHNNKDHFKCVSDFVSKCCLRKPFTRSPNMYKEYLAEFWYSTKSLEKSKVFFSTPTSGIFGEVGVNTFRNDIGAHYLPHSSEYVAPPSIDIVRPWFKTIRYREDIPTKGTLKKSLLLPRWRLLMAHIIQCLGGKTKGFDQITNKDAIILYSLVNGINIDYASIFWEDIIIKLNKKHREKVVPYTRFLSLLMMHKMKEGYRDGELTLYPNQVFSVNSWALKPNQPKEPPFIDHMLAIYAADMPVKKATKGGSTKAPTSSKTGHLKKRKDSNSAMDSNPSQLPVSTPMDTGMHKEDQQVTGGPTSLGVTTSFIVHSESVSGFDALADSTAKADLRLFAPSSDPHVLADQTKSISEGLETVLAQPRIGKGANSIARQVEEEEASNTIKLEDLAKLVSDGVAIWLCDLSSNIAFCSLRFVLRFHCVLSQDFIAFCLETLAFSKDYWLRLTRKSCRFVVTAF